MRKPVNHLLPSLKRVLEQFGENLRLARLRRRYSTEIVAQRSGMARATLYRIERGDPSVSLGKYARVMQVFSFEEDLKQLALDDVLGRKLQDLGLGTRARAPKRRKPAPVSDMDNYLREREEAARMVVEDEGILGPTPVIRGTRVPVYDVAATLNAGTPMHDILRMYPSLNERQVVLAGVYARETHYMIDFSRMPLPTHLKVRTRKKVAIQAEP